MKRHHTPADLDHDLGYAVWKAIFQAAESLGGFECYIIEQERCPPPLTPMQSVERCIQNFRRLHG